MLASNDRSQPSTTDPLGRVAVHVRTRHERATVTLSCAHGRTVVTDPEAVGALSPNGDIPDAAGLILAARVEHERGSGCDCIPRLAAALGLDPDLGR